MWALRKTINSTSHWLHGRYWRKGLVRKAYQSLTSYFHVVLEFIAVVVGFHSFLLLMYLEARTFVMMMKIYCHIIYI